MLDVWCQKQLIGFSLHCVQSAVTHTELRADKDREKERRRREIREIYTCCKKIRDLGV